MFIIHVLDNRGFNKKKEVFCYFDPESAEHFLFLLQLASTMREWDIPYEDLAIGDPIGKGRFGTVHK